MMEMGKEGTSLKPRSAAEATGAIEAMRSGRPNARAYVIIPPFEQPVAWMWLRSMQSFQKIIINIIWAK
jgi:hypothetical protein